MSNWQYATPVNQSGVAAVGGQGGSLALAFRDPLDARRAMQGAQVPYAQYPDGYLGTIQSRREDRLLDQLKKNLNQRSYQRGVHVGERVDPAAYLWPAEFGPMTSLDRQLQITPGPDGVLYVPRAAPLMTIAEQVETYGGRQIPRGAGALAQMRAPNPQNPVDLQRLAPTWK